MYVPAPLPVSLCPVHANCMKHESKTCPPPPPINEIGTQKISDNIMKHKIVLASFVEVHWVTTTIEKVSVKVYRSKSVSVKVIRRFAYVF